MKKVVIITAEASGDFLGAQLAKELYKNVDDISIFGVTGKLMKEVQVNTIIDNEVFNLMGYMQVFANLRRILIARKQIMKVIEEMKPDVVIGIDAPDLNLALAVFCAKLNIKYVQYVCPSFWVWRPQRINLLKDYCDQVLCLFPHEAKHCAIENIKHQFVGHPLVDIINESKVSKQEARQQLGYKTNDKIIAILPGSRPQEIKSHFKLFTEVAQNCQSLLPEVKIAWAPANSRLLSSVDEGMEIFPGKSRLLLSAADTALIKSGTISFEALLLNCPQVVSYIVSKFDAFFINHNLRDYHKKVFSLPNLMSENQFIAEFIQDNCDADKMARSLVNLLHDNDFIKNRYEEIKAKFPANASLKAAEAIQSYL